MSYIRLTMAAPPVARLTEVRALYERIVAHVATLPGYVSGWVVIPGADTDEVGRITVWETPADAHLAANDPLAMALHAQLHNAAGGRLWDRSFAADTVAA